MSQQGGCPPSVLFSGAGRAAEEVGCRRHPATAEEERGNRVRDPNGGGRRGLRDLGPVEVAGGDRMVWFWWDMPIGW